MRVKLWGTRGSVPRAGPETVEYGGDTSAIELKGTGGSWLILDAGSGLARVPEHLPAGLGRIDLLLTHLHMDHIQGLGFFPPLRDEGVETHIWGPISTTQGLAERLGRYLSPPLFPLRVRDLPSLHFHDLEPGRFTIGPFTITADLICHPGPTLGYRIEQADKVLAYLPDHEPALGFREFPGEPAWTSGFDLIHQADVLIHDTQYTEEEYADRVGWGHSTLQHAIGLAAFAEVRTLVTFHHDPEHSDEALDHLLDQALADGPPLELLPGTAGAVVNV